MVFLFFIVSFALLAVNTPHPVMIELLDEDGISYPYGGFVSFNAYINSRPEEVLTKNSDNCSYPYTFGENPAKFIHIQCASFTTQWQAGDLLIIEASKSEANYHNYSWNEGWHLSTVGAYGGTGNSWWMGDETLGGYQSSRYLTMNTPQVTLAAGSPELRFKMALSCEDPGVYQAWDAWDGANVRISTNAGETWTVLTPTSPDYNGTSFSAWDAFGEGIDVPGWGSQTLYSTWQDASFDLSAYAGQDVKIRFAFASDGGWDTDDGPGCFGFRVDNIEIDTSTGTFLSNGDGAAGDELMTTHIPSTKRGSVFLTNDSFQVTFDTGFTPDAPLPVTLSSFTATYLDDLPVLQWVTQSEESNQGWNIYRNQVEDQNNSVQVNAELISGSGTTSGVTEYVFTDEYEIENGITYYYWLESIGMNGQVESYGPISLQIPDDDGNGSPEVPLVYGLYQNYPNPFNPITTISFALEQEGDIKLDIYNIKGQKVRELFNGFAKKDMVLTYIWDGLNEKGQEVSSGIYMYQLKTENKTYTKKMNVIK